MTIPADCSSSSASVSENEYEILDFNKKAADVEAEEEPEENGFKRADVAEEIVQIEPLYSMIIKTPLVVKPVELELAAAPAEDAESEEQGADVEEVEDPPIQSVSAFADEVLREVERRRSLGLESGAEATVPAAEYPVPWSEKLPDPPTPFQDVAAPLNPPESSDSESVMSDDSLQHADQVQEKIPDGITLQSGEELLGETRTEDVMILEHGNEEFGTESSTDPTVPSLPLLPPPSDHSDNESAVMRFTISTYGQRTLDRSDSLNSGSHPPLEKPNFILPKALAESDSFAPRKSASEDSPSPAPSSAPSGDSINSNVAPPSLPFNMEFIQQFQNALNSISGECGSCTFINPPAEFDSTLNVDPQTLRCEPCKKISCGCSSSLCLYRCRRPASR